MVDVLASAEEEAVDALVVFGIVGLLILLLLDELEESERIF